MRERMWLQCLLCARRVCMLYHLDGQHACRSCYSLWYAAQESAARSNGPSRRTVGRQLSTEAALHVAADLRATLCGTGPY
jgi:hypothetical protein